MSTLMDYDIRDQDGEAVTLVRVSELERLREIAETAEDVAAYDSVKAAIARGDDEMIPAEVVRKILGGESPIRVWRKHRGISQTDLASRVEVSNTHLSRVEKGHEQVSLGLLRKIADVLNVTLDDLVEPNMG